MGCAHVVEPLVLHAAWKHKIAAQEGDTSVRALEDGLDHGRRGGRVDEHGPVLCAAELRPGFLETVAMRPAAPQALRVEREHRVDDVDRAPPDGLQPLRIEHVLHDHQAVPPESARRLLSEPGVSGVNHVLRKPLNAGTRLELAAEGLHLRRPVLEPAAPPQLAEG